MRTHPPTLLKLARRCIAEEKLFGRGARVLVACSGGPDSNALLDVLASLRAPLGHALVAAGVDHGLRPEAAAELDGAEALARAHGVAFERIELAVPSGGNLQARARRARLEALQSAAVRQGAAAIATGHTADDRAETVILRLLRGAGPRGLAVLPPRAPWDGGVPLVRPLVRARRSDVLAHLARHRIDHAEDPSNRDGRFLRVRVRREVMPLLEQLSPGIVGHLCALADALGPSEADEALAGLGRAQRLAVARALASDRAELEVRLRGERSLSLQVGPSGPAKKPGFRRG